MDRIREFIEEQFLIEFDEDFPDHTDLFKAGVMDSFGYIQLIRFLEAEFSIKFSKQEITSNILVSLKQISDYTADKVKAKTTL